MPGVKSKSGGARKGSGRKRKSAEEELEQLLNSAWPKKLRKTTIELYAQRASKGDFASFQLLMAYAYGKPKEKLQHSGPDGGAIPVSFTNAVVKIYGRKS